VFRAAASSGTVDDGYASWTVKGGVTVRRGDDLTLVCSVTGLTTLDVVRVYHRTDGHARTIADNSDVKRPFAVLDRYSVQYTYDNGIGTTRIGYRGTHFYCSNMLSMEAEVTSCELLTACNSCNSI
jgi:hypothetical protein